MFNIPATIGFSKKNMLYSQVLSYSSTIDVDTNNSPYIGYVDNDSGSNEVGFYFYTGSLWETNKFSANNNNKIGLCVDASNYIHIVYNYYDSGTGTSTMYHSFYNGSTWSTPSVVISETGTTISNSAIRLAIDKSAGKIVVWYAKGHAYELYYSEYVISTNTWTETKYYNGNTTYNYNVSQVHYNTMHGCSLSTTDTATTPVSLYLDGCRTAGSNLYPNRLYIDAEWNMSSYSSIWITSSSDVHIAGFNYGDGSPYELLYFNYGGSLPWTNKTLLMLTDVAVHQIEIVEDSSGDLHVFYTTVENRVSPPDPQPNRFYKISKISGTWETSATLILDNLDYDIMEMKIDSNNKVHFLGDNKYHTYQI